jgi:integrase
MVMAATGIRPSQLKRVQAEDSDFERRIWIVAGGKRGEPISRYLNGDMLTAWRLFVAVSAWGEYDSRSYARVLRTAGRPNGIRPYNVRHAIGQDLCEQGEDLKLVAVGLGLSSRARNTCGTRRQGPSTNTYGSSIG